MTAESPSRVDQLIAECADALRSGKRAECLALAEQHPRHAAEISAFLADFDRIEEQFAPLRELAGGAPRSAAEIHTLGAGDTAAKLPKAGGSFGDYDLLSEIARGGMGVVYKARQKSLNRIVALKMVLAGRSEAATDRDRFLAEARAVARLNHPHIVPIYEVGERGGQPYFTMEYFSGGSLRDQFDEMRRDRRGIAHLMVTTARAVEHAHRRGILHRDIKPNNVLLDERGEPHVTDFGLAKQLNEESDLTQAGAIVGTPSYMAPEQASADTDLTTAADVYGLGALLYELLAGRPPFKGNTPMETMLAVMSQEPPRPRKLNPETEADLETICLKCLAKDPLARYGSAEALADDLQRWLEGKPIVARPVTAAERLVKWSRRQPLLAGSLATILIAAVTLLVLAGFLWQNAEARAQAVKDLDAAETKLAQVDGERQQAEAKKFTAEKLADEQRKLADQQKDLADKISIQVEQLQQAADEAEARLTAADRAARRVNYAADMQLAHSAWRDENVALVYELLDKQRPAEGGEDLRGFEWRYLWRQSHEAVSEWTINDSPNDGIIGGLAVAPDGKRVATASRDMIKIWNLADGKLLRTIAAKDSTCIGLAFTDGGRKLAMATKKQVGNLDQFMQRAVVGPAMKKEKFAFSTLAEQVEMRVWNLADDRPPKILPLDAAAFPGTLQTVLTGGVFVQHEGDAMFVSALASSADGKRMAFCGMRTDVPGGNRAKPGEIQGGKLLVWDAEKNEVVATQNTPMIISAIAFSPDGKSLAIGNSDGAVGIGEPNLAQPPRVLLGHRGSVNTIKFSSDGKQLISGAADGQVIIWDAAGGKEIRRLRGNVFPIYQLELVPQSKRLVSAALDGSLKVWNTDSAPNPLILRGHTNAVASFRFSRDGKELISVDNHQTILTWDALNGKRKEERTPAVGKGFNPGFRLSNDGALIAWSEGQRHTIRYWTPAKGKEQSLEWKDHVPWDLAISPDNKYIAARDLMVDGGAAVWSTVDGKQVAVLDSAIKGTVSAPAFSPDGTQIAASTKDGLLIWNWKEAQHKLIPPRKEVEIGSVTYSCDGQLLAYAVYFGTGGTRGSAVEIIDAKSEEVIARCQGAGRWVTKIAFSPDGTRLATSAISASQQTMLKLWDAETGREMFSFSIPPSTISDLAFCPDGHRLAAAVQTLDLAASIAGRPQPGEIYIWDATPVATELPAVANANVRPLQGTWVVDSAELNGQLSQSSVGDKFTFDGDKVTIENKVKKSEPIVFRLDTTKSPAEIDIEDKPAMLGVYELKGDTLTICYSQERPTEFDSKQGLLLKLRREPNKEIRP